MPFVPFCKRSAIVPNDSSPLPPTAPPPVPGFSTTITFGAFMPLMPPLTQRSKTSQISWTIIVNLSGMASTAGSGYFSPRSTICVLGVLR